MKRSEVFTGVWIGTGLILGLMGVLVFLPGLIPGMAVSIIDETVYWLLARAGGFVAYILLWVSVVFGLLLTSRTAKMWPGVRRANVIHQHISLLALGYTFFHALVLLGDQYIGFSVSSILVPFFSPYEPAAVGLGQTGAWLILLIVLTSTYRRRISPRMWRMVHYASFVTFILVLVHAFLAGTESQELWAAAFYAFTALVIYALTIYRVLVRMVSAKGKRYGGKQETHPGQTASGGG